MVVRTADGRAAALDFREKAPSAARRNMYLDAGGALTDRSVIGHLASGVPGSVAGTWEAHKRFASLPWSELIQPAINLADSLIVHERLARSLLAHEGRLQRYPASAAVFLTGWRRVSASASSSAIWPRHFGVSRATAHTTSTAVARLTWSLPRWSVAAGSSRDATASLASSRPHLLRAPRVAA
jgi:hypothetical protein